MKPKLIQQRWGSNTGKQCAWHPCDNKALLRGLCRQHYDFIHASVNPPDWDEPADCQCPPDLRKPQRCLLAATVTIAGAYQCGRCLKRIDESLVR